MEDCQLLRNLYGNSTFETLFGSESSCCNVDSVNCNTNSQITVLKIVKPPEDFNIVYQLSALTELCIQGIRESAFEFSNEIGNLKNLVKLDITNSTVRALKFPDSLFSLNNLRELTIDDNTGFTVNLSGQFSSMESLEKLVLSGSTLKGSIPQTFVGFKGLKNLDLRANPKLSGSIPLDLLSSSNTDFASLKIEGNVCILPSQRLEPWNDAKNPICPSTSTTKIVSVLSYEVAECATTEGTLIQSTVENTSIYSPLNTTQAILSSQAIISSLPSQSIISISSPQSSIDSSEIEATNSAQASQATVKTTKHWNPMSTVPNYSYQTTSTAVPGPLFVPVPTKKVNFATTAVPEVVLPMVQPLTPNNDKGNNAGSIAGIIILLLIITGIIGGGGIYYLRKQRRDVKQRRHRFTRMEVTGLH